MHKLVLASLLGVMLSLAGFFGYSFFSSYNDAPTSSETLSLGGYGSIKAYHADGTLYRVWEGHNALTQSAKNMVAACASGLSTTPGLVGACSGWINSIAIEPVREENAPPLGIGVPPIEATNTLLPEGCDPQGNNHNCSGWKTEATFDEQITTSGSIYRIVGGDFDSTVGGFLPFDDITVSPPIEVVPGDRLIVTITFNVSG